MKFSPFAIVLLPPAWTWSAGLFLRPFVTALGSSNPDLSASAWQCVVFVTSATLAGWVLGKAAGGSEPKTDLTRRDWQAARERVITEEKESREYQVSIRPGNLALGVANGNRTQVFHFPAGITLDHLTAFGHCIAADKRPTFRNLNEAFDHNQWATFRNYLMVAEINKFGILAEYLDGRDAWDVTALGRKMSIIWLFQTSPSRIPSSAIKCGITRNKTTFEQSNNQNE